MCFIFKTLLKYLFIKQHEDTKKHIFLWLFALFLSVLFTKLTLDCQFMTNLVTSQLCNFIILEKIIHLLPKTILAEGFCFEFKHYNALALKICFYPCITFVLPNKQELHSNIFYFYQRKETCTNIVLYFGQSSLKICSYCAKNNFTAHFSFLHSKENFVLLLVLLSNNVQFIQDDFLSLSYCLKLCLEIAIV